MSKELKKTKLITYNKRVVPCKSSWILCIFSPSYQAIENNHVIVQ